MRFYQIGSKICKSQSRKKKLYTTKVQSSKNKPVYGRPYLSLHAPVHSTSPQGFLMRTSLVGFPLYTTFTQRHRLCLILELPQVEYIHLKRTAAFKPQNLHKQEATRLHHNPKSAALCVLYEAIPDAAEQTSVAQRVQNPELRLHFVFNKWLKAQISN